MNQQLPQLTIHDCHAAGMTIKEAASALGIKYAAAQKRARYAGLRLRRDYSANAERARTLHANPEFAAAHSERMRQRHANPKYNPLAAMTPEQRADYTTLQRAGFTRAEAFESMGFQP
jgi:hypothetical protein